MAIYKRGRGFELEATKKQIQVVVRVGLEPGTAGLRVQHADHSAMLRPLCNVTSAVCNNFTIQQASARCKQIFQTVLIISESQITLKALISMVRI